MKKIIFSLLLLLIFSNISFSQTGDNYKDAVLKLFKVSHTEQTYNNVVKQMLSMFKQQQTNATSEFWNEVEKEMFDKSFNEITDMLLPVYKKYLTIEDLNELIKFYESPIGQKFADTNPLIAQESMKIGQEWGLNIGKKIVEKLRSKGYQTK